MSNRTGLKFFLPDWDEQIDPGYDFVTERFTLARDPHDDDVYAHEVFGEPVHDGLLVSRMALGEQGPKRDHAERWGLRSFLRLPSSLTLFGDCGAFGYLRDPLPRFETADIVDYYGRLGFDLGVSIDHAVVPEFPDQQQFRYDLTLRNAEEFLKLHRLGRYRYEPVGAIQGWDPPSFADAAQAVTAMGYRYIAIGGQARLHARRILPIVRAVMEVVPTGTRVHVFGIARLGLLEEFVSLGVTSVDSAAPMRHAWLSAKENYYGQDNKAYVAIRIPVADQERWKAESLVHRSDRSLRDLRTAEAAALAAIREYDRRQLGLRPTLDTLIDYDAMLAERRERVRIEQRRDEYRETLKDRPWRRCPCRICREIGVEVVIFRGNNRNRRRGFHNLWMFRRALDRLRFPDLVHSGALSNRRNQTTRSL
jgi:hypothetical protein